MFVRDEEDADFRQHEWVALAGPELSTENTSITAMFSHETLFHIWRAGAKEEGFDILFRHISNSIEVQQLSDEDINKLKAAVRNLKHRFEEKWEKAHRHYERFVEKNASWLQQEFQIPVLQTGGCFPGPSTSSGRRGRPKKLFQEASDSTKQRRARSLVDSYTNDELSSALRLSLNVLGKRDSAALVQEVALASPTRGTAIKKARKSADSGKPESLSPDKALALMTDCNLSSRQYRSLRAHCLDVSPKLYPPIHILQQAKNDCYPSDITVTETSAEIKLQSLIDHTVSRLAHYLTEVLVAFPNLSDGSINVIFKWGCDGSNQAVYKQKFDGEGFSDENLFSLSIVPVQMNFQTNEGSEEGKKVIWSNPVPSSTRYCRPLKLIFSKETPETITREVESIKREIDLLNPTTINIENVDVLIKPILVLCMVDGKVCNALASCKSTQTCYLCGAKPSEMNKLDIVLNKSVDSSLLNIGLSPLHARIRFMECILHISYKLQFKAGHARGVEMKTKVNERKKTIQDRFRRELGLLVDVPKQQAGNTNDGNTSRRFFKNADKTAEITGVNRDLIERFGLILQCINSGFALDIEKFESYVIETRNLYLRDYSWYNMPVSVHKILFHARQVIEACLLPIGQMSEEAQESRNKDNRKFREMFTRKDKRIHTNTDLLHRLLITSDPVIAGLRQKPQTKRDKLSPELLSFLRAPPTFECTENNAGDSCDSDSDSTI